MSTVRSVHNLSFSINLPKTTVHSENIVVAVNETLTKFCQQTQFQDFMNLYILQNCTTLQNESSSTMQTGKTILCEINAGLWNKGLTSSICSITRHTYPHYVVVQELINYLLNGPASTDFALLEEFFWKLLLSHPPKPEFFDYYWSILTDTFVVLNGKKVEEQGIFFCLLEALITCFNNKEFLDGSDCLKNAESNVNNSKNTQYLEVLDDFNNINLGNFSFNQSSKKNVNFFEALPWNEKIRRCLIALTFIYNILEMNFAICLQSKEFKVPSLKKNTRSLFSNLLWQESRDVGLINKEVHKILNLYKVVTKTRNFNFSQKILIQKLVHLLAEVMRTSDSMEEVKYPFLGIKSNDLARELSINLYQQLSEQCQNNELVSVDCQLLNLKPSWLRLLICSHLLSFITGYRCAPELTGASDILEYIAHAKCRSKEDKVRTEDSRTKVSVNPKILQRLKKLKSVNAKMSCGKTLLHLACESDNVEEVRALLTFPELDLNATDRSGWTALHLAAYKGNIATVKELLSFRPKSGDVQKSVNTRFRGPDSYTPLMCAASEGQTDVCRLLLEHTGSVLLEDVNEANQTSVELSKGVDVLKILKYYEENIIWTVHSPKDIDVSAKHKEIVIKLCVEMIQSYFCTHRTWDVYQTLKKQEKDSFLKANTNQPLIEPKWDYVRYHRDIKRNIYKLKRLLPKLVNIPEFKNSHEIFTRILSFNKSC